MTFNPKDYVSSSESIILSGSVNMDTGYNIRKIVKIVLTNKKVIAAGDDYLQSIPLNRIAHISCDKQKIVICSSAGIETMSLYYTGNPDWYNEIMKEILKRIG